MSGPTWPATGRTRANPAAARSRICCSSSSRRIRWRASGTLSDWGRETGDRGQETGVRGQVLRNAIFCESRQTSYARCVRFDGFEVRSRAKRRRNQVGLIQKYEKGGPKNVGHVGSLGSLDLV